MIKLLKDKDTEWLKARYTCKELNIEVGIGMVIFGWRVHAGTIDSGFYELDYCCGADKEMVEVMLSAVKAIIEKNDANWKIFPIQNTKPIFNDMPCLIKLLQLAGEHEKFEVPDLKMLRLLINSKIFETNNE